MIPKIIYMCDKTLEHISKYSQNWKKLNPDYKIRLYDDELCIKFLQKSYGDDYVNIFKYIPDGPIKADFWRLCILYRNGGVYTDADNEPLVSIDSFLEENIDLLLCTAYMNKMNFNPNLIIVKKRNPVIKSCILWYLNKYEKKIYSYWSWSIMKCFTEVLKIPNYNKKEGIYNMTLNDIEYRIQILKECPGKYHHDAHNLYKSRRIFNNRYKNWCSSSHSFREIKYIDETNEEHYYKMLINDMKNE